MACGRRIELFQDCAARRSLKRSRFASEVDETGYGSASDGVRFKVLPDQFVRISIRRVWRKIKKPQRAIERGDERFCQFCNVGSPWSIIRNILRFDPTMSRFRNSMKTAAL